MGIIEGTYGEFTGNTGIRGDFSECDPVLASPVWVLGQEQIALYLVASQSAPVPHGGRPVKRGMMLRFVYKDIKSDNYVTCVNIIGAGVNAPSRGALTLLVKVTI